ncbi:MAG: hypothetical protein PVI30_03365, partial [Myxococcales bacterium]
MTSSETDVRTRDASELGQRTGLRRRPVVATALTVASFDVLCAMELLRARVFDGFVFSSVEVLALMLRPLLLLAVGSQLLFGMVVLRGGPRLGRMACWVAVATVVGTGTALLASALHNPHDGVLASARNLWLLGVVLGVWLVALVAGWRYLRQPLRVPAPVVWGLLAIYVLLDFWLIDGFVWRETFVFGSFATLVASANLLALGLTVSVLTAWVVRSVSPSRGLHAACLAWLGAHVTVAIGGQLVSGNQATQHAWRTHAPLTVAAARIEPNRVMRAQRPAACRDDRQGPARECGTPPEVPREPRNNLLLVTIDALRADRVTHRLMPNLTEFSEQAVIWENAYTPEISTYRTLYTYLHNTVPCHWSLPRVLGELGYQTFAISAISRPALLAHFDIAVSLENERGHQAVRLVTTGDDTVARFEQLLDSSSDKPFFAWVHFFDVHG